MGESPVNIGIRQGLLTERICVGGVVYHQTGFPGCLHAGDAEKLVATGPQAWTLQHSQSDTEGLDDS